MVDNTDEILQLLDEIKESQRIIEKNRLKIQFLIKDCDRQYVDYLEYNI
ncbi:MAG: hypothetical protein QM398_12330 [Thermoproteota archaeon]|jgi:hypothetical protein|nr:hypothetical protein [Thermoproteota archaeon]